MKQQIHYEGKTTDWFSLTAEQIKDMLTGSIFLNPVPQYNFTPMEEHSVGCQPAVFLAEAGVRRIVKEEIEKALANT